MQRPAAKGALRFRIRPVDRINQLTETAEAAPLRPQNKSWQVPDLGLIFFRPKRRALHDPPRLYEIGKVFVQVCNPATAVFDSR